jgi:hypothetical protein
MPKLSRRTMIAAAAAAPLGGGMNGAEAADPVVVKVGEWKAAKAAQDVMVREWQGLESVLLDRAQALGMDLAQAHRSRLPEARAMRALMRRIEAMDGPLDRATGRIVLMRPSSTAGALAKIELGLTIQGPHDWEEYAYALVQDGWEQLVRYL